MGEEWKNWCVEAPNLESDVSAEDGRMSELALLELKQVLEGLLWEEHEPFWLKIQFLRNNPSYFFISLRCQHAARKADQAVSDLVSGNLAVFEGPRR